MASNKKQKKHSFAKYLKKVNEKFKNSLKNLADKSSSIKDSLKERASNLLPTLKSSLYAVANAAKILMVTILFTVSSFSAGLIHEGYIASRVGDNVLFIKNPVGALHRGSATGFEVKAPSGKIYTLTNAHVCELQKDGFLLVEEKRHSDRFIPRRVLEIYEDNDLCLVEGMEGYSGLTLADDITVGQSAWEIGYPLGQELNISKGCIKGFNTVLKQYAAQTDVPTFPGNSGSPLVNMYGNVIGVVFASNPRTAWGSAVPLEMVKQFLKAY